MRLALAAALLAVSALLLHDAVCGPPRPPCREAARRGLASAERACREQYLQSRDPDDGLALAQVLLARRELRGAAAIAQGLLLTSARPDALLLLARMALLEGRLDEGQRSLELAAEQLLRVERWREGAAELIELGELMASRGQAAAGRAAIARALELAQRHGEAALVARGGAALERLR
jgi:hypothetical protein